MSIKVLILGSGSALPTISSNQSAQIVEVDNYLFLVDCGEGTQIELRRNKVKVQKIDHVFISHLHGDHFFGLVGMLSTMHLLGRKKEISIYGPKGLEDIVAIQFRNAGSHLSFKMNFEVVDESKQLLFENSKLRVSALPLKHRIPCFGFLFQEKLGLRKIDVAALAKYKIPVHARKGLTEGQDFKTEEGLLIPNREITKDPEPPKSYAYCSDTAYYSKLVEALSPVDLLYHEATFLDSEKERAKKTFHSTAKDAAKVAQETGAKKLLLGHFSNRYKAKDGFLQESRQLFKESYIAEEGQMFEA